MDWRSRSELYRRGESPARLPTHYSRWRVCAWSRGRDACQSDSLSEGFTRRACGSRWSRSASEQTDEPSRCAAFHFYPKVPRPRESSLRMRVYARAFVYVKASSTVVFLLSAFHRGEFIRTSARCEVLEVHLSPRWFSTMTRAKSPHKETLPHKNCCVYMSIVNIYMWSI